MMSGPCFKAVLSGLPGLSGLHGLSGVLWGWCRMNARRHDGAI